MTVPKLYPVGAVLEDFDHLAASMDLVGVGHGEKVKGRRIKGKGDGLRLTFLLPLFRAGR